MNYQPLVSEIEKLKSSDVKNKIAERILEFKNTGKGGCEELYKELCYCILTANFSAERAIRIHGKICERLCDISGYELEKILKESGYRFPFKAEYIVSARKYKEAIKDLLEKNIGEEEFRTWLIKNIKGLGYKEASHFMRNIGYSNIAIIDRHILNILEKFKILNHPKTLTAKKYMEIERLLREIAAQANLTLAELDLYLWYMETGQVLK
ncbi:MAG: N-glycosylase/DNA lyase [Candidatus Odinarchaeum yellowstonii]|uniref:8-oxoguanine DNA glycosylase/AP lyase n=1 Tax=Odinarchaeota yellowstonii (strain LCB_4) TaxID=1841599 RepID=A0AAF0IBE3_ODILC|nr:MAG: N-glycosylase/DNA lyase [Candidatus Odinarchaeum yellowstonii]